LLRGGLELDFKGKGLTMVLLTLLPQVFEATAAAIATRYILGFPWPLCFAHGFTLGAVSPAVVVPSMMILHKQGYGVEKGIPTSMIAASSFDDIIAITAFGVFSTIAFNQAPGGGAEKEDTTVHEIGINAFQLGAGLGVGLTLGFSFILFQSCAQGKCRTIAKTICCLIVGIIFPIVCETIHFPESKFVGIIFFGYGCFRVWGEDKPEEELASIWMFFQPVLFGTVGAAVQFSKLGSGADIAMGVIVILIGLTFRWIGAFCACLEPKYTIKEKAFVAFGWIPKATVQAALGGMTMATATNLGIEEYRVMGEKMLTMAVFAICMTAPAGAIFIAQLGPIWLEKKKGGAGDEEKISHEPIPRRSSMYGDADEILNFRKMYHDKDDL